MLIMPRGKVTQGSAWQKHLEILRNYDFILTPSTPGTAFEFGKNSADPIKMYLEDIFTVQAPIVGIPAISVPSGVHSNGLPIGLQLMAGFLKKPNFSILPPKSSRFGKRLALLF